MSPASKVDVVWLPKILEHKIVTVQENGSSISKQFLT
jgi:hypothetical protein